MTIEVSTPMAVSTPTDSILTNPEVGTAKVSTKVDRAAYLGNLLSLRSPVENLPWLQELRNQAAAIVQELAIPTTRDEDWRFTDLSALVAQTWQQPDPAIDLKACDSIVLPEAGCRLVFMNGVFKPHLSKLEDLPAGVFVGNLAQLPSDRLAAVQAALGHQTGAEEVFTALNTASLTDAAIVCIPRNVAVEKPIHLVFLSRTAGTTTIAQPRCLVLAETGSAVTLVEEYSSADAPGTYFTNAVTEVVVGDNAQVNHTRIQWENQQAFHIGKTAVSQGRDARYICTAISLGGQVSRHHFEVYSQGEQTHSQLMGLTIVDGDRTADTHSLIAFSKPYCTATQVNKCIADGKAHGVFNGRIYVPKLAQQTDASQMSRNLVLSSKARIDTKPQLEIVADNVKCAHGATVSQLEDDEVFYLQSRGIGADAARKLLTFAFATEIINQIPVASLRQSLTQMMRDRQAAS
ncbi:Fe-S cluster assembly protein SufD [Alkalinema sp. FACHB-956]|uniref:Fe-S cluster assembly protein SufD n=1 Tax=Alkalinema sp. FACHB-956 TaxID=2692768 RepID=UPI001683D12C|nr:Fe-S cluster assembly protein SufD [Alkalinema sp. FACHB-956]MBD2327074.1 Fe-S cluster assembly protein SufD [Alkalinema sp. FACHB-956]